MVYTLLSIYFPDSVYSFFSEVFATNGKDNLLKPDPYIDPGYSRENEDNMDPDSDPSTFSSKERTEN
jgi:hypothetical protein